MHINIQWQKITLYPKNKNISGVRQTSSFQTRTKPGIFSESGGSLGSAGIWETKKLFGCDIQEQLQEQWISYRQNGKWSASNEAFGSQQNSVWFPRACLSSSCQYSEHNNKFNQTHWQQLYRTIPGDKANYNILFNERLWSPWNALR